MFYILHYQSYKLHLSRIIVPSKLLFLMEIWTNEDGKTHGILPEMALLLAFKKENFFNEPNLGNLHVSLFDWSSSLFKLTRLLKLAGISPSSLLLSR